VMNWVMRRPPLLCAGTGGRKGRNDPGDCWAYYACYYQYPDSVGITFSGKQYPVEGADEGIIVNIYGEKGALLTNYGGETMIRAGKEGFYRGGKTPDIYVSGVVNNIAEFQRLIAAKDCANAVVEAAAQSTAIAVMGREAALKQQVVTWEELQNKGEKIDAGLEGLKA
jgi:myo-inositol 2-dehydrogenase/D-chiro-inositol 1-dehydrogenase